jgi:hypothetical protein
MFNSLIASAARTGVAVVCIGAASVSLASAASATDGVYGDPAAAAKYWQAQSLEDNCGLISVADVVGEITGHAPTEEQMVTLAQKTPSGTKPRSDLCSPERPEPRGRQRRH